MSEIQLKTFPCNKNTALSEQGVKSGIRMLYSIVVVINAAAKITLEFAKTLHSFLIISFAKLLKTQRTLNKVMVTANLKQKA